MEKSKTNKRYRIPDKKGCRLFRLPVEILGNVISYLDVEDVVSLIPTCKYMQSVMNPCGSEGKRIWHKLRLSGGWPDPSVISLTDFQFFKRLLGRGCDFCTLAPQVRIIKWEFGGIRMCKECMKSHTIRHYQLDHETEVRCACVPSIAVNTWARGTVLTYRTYLKNSILEHDPTNEEAVQMRANVSATYEFAKKCDEISREKLLQHQNLRQTLQAKRRRDVIEFTSEKFPEVSLGVYWYINTFLRAVKTHKPFTARSRSIYARSFANELEQNKHRLIKIQFDQLLSQLIGFVPLAWTRTPEYSIFLATSSRLPTYTEVELLSNLIRKRLTFGRFSS